MTVTYWLGLFLLPPPPTEELLQYVPPPIETFLKRESVLERKSLHESIIISEGKLNMNDQGTGHFVSQRSTPCSTLSDFNVVKCCGGKPSENEGTESMSQVECLVSCIDMGRAGS